MIQSFAYDSLGNAFNGAQTNNISTFQSGTLLNWASNFILGNALAVKSGQMAFLPSQFPMVLFLQHAPPSGPVTFGKIPDKQNMVNSIVNAIPAISTAVKTNVAIMQNNVIPVILPAPRPVVKIPNFVNPIVSARLI